MNMKQLRDGLICLVLIGATIYWGPTVLKTAYAGFISLGESGKRRIEEQAGVPMIATWREATGPGKVLVLHYLNREHPLQVTVSIKRPSTGEQKVYKLDFDQAELKERQIGWLEGWTFALGDTVQLTSGNYRPISATIK
jgi:hypothetical protein